ncbi:potassium channel family protein [Nocardioides sp.]|jgi:hypothetical protein|uniref:potassium channel family protein n=1 Tax=Nocardioides sp. TaxID=35761 RepID=UPI001D7C2BE2|nr:potassium channel family protein [Nocardioides sp.]MBU1802547.1 two pore domain potassium channel family protein [Actinomycetota bacterium]MDE0776171.1 ion channel [Nocardioides sp.]
MIWLLTISGALLIVVALRDIFHTLWHPGGFGILTRTVFALTWRASKVRRGGARPSVIAGPLGILLTLGMWTSLVVIGFALIYLPRLADDFNFSSSLQPGQSSNLSFALYVSFVAVTTLGLGDVTPATPELRLVVPVEALLGFLLLTAGISWILQLYPALNRRRALARRLSSMRRQQVDQIVETGQACVAAQQLEAVRDELATVEMDLRQYAESYYFREDRADISLAATLPYVEQLVDAGKRSASPDVQVAAAALGDGLDEILQLLRDQYLPKARGSESTFAALIDDHRQSQARADD